MRTLLSTTTASPATIFVLVFLNYNRVLILPVILTLSVLYHIGNSHINDSKTEQFNQGTLLEKKEQIEFAKEKNLKDIVLTNNRTFFWSWRSLPFFLGAVSRIGEYAGFGNVLTIAQTNLLRTVVPLAVGESSGDYQGV